MYKKHVKDKFIEVLINNRGNITKACKACGIWRQTLYNWRKDDPEFSERIANVKESIIDMAEENLIELIEEKNFQAIKFYLSTQGRERGYIERSEVEHSGDSINITINSRYSPEGDDNIED